jgi:hypothetical protein
MAETLTRRTIEGDPINDGEKGKLFNIEDVRIPD